MKNIKKQVEFQRKKIEERKEKVAIRLEKSREGGTYDAYINQEMIIEFSQQLKTHYEVSRSDATVSILIADIKKKGISRLRQFFGGRSECNCDRCRYRRRPVWRIINARKYKQQEEDYYSENSTGFQHK